MTEPDAGSAVTDLKTSAQAGRRALRHQRHQGVLHLQPGRGDLSRLRALRARPRRHRLGDRRARHAGLHHRPAVELHERRAMVRAAFRELPHAGRERAARPRRLQEADGELQRRAPRQHRALARASAATPTTRRASYARHARAVRPAAVRVPGPAMEVRRDGDQARKRAAPALSRRRQRRPRPAVGLRDRGRQGGLQPDRLRGRARGGAGHGRARLQPRDAGRILHAAQPRLDDRRRLDRDAEEPHRRARVRPPLRSAQPPTPKPPSDAPQ